VGAAGADVCVSAVPFYGLQLWSKPLNATAVAALILNLLPEDSQVIDRLANVIVRDEYQKR
jgi:hypothetical protein